MFEKALEADYASSKEIANLWCKRAEFELRIGELGDTEKDGSNANERALEIMNLAILPPDEDEDKKKALELEGEENLTRKQKKALRRKQYQEKKSGKGSGRGRKTAKDGVRFQPQVWSFLLDLEEMVGTPSSVRAAYDSVMKIGVASPLMVLNYSRWLKNHNYFEESYNVMERGVELFDFPHSGTIWCEYLDMFVERYGSSKKERTRDLFQHCINQLSSSLFLPHPSSVSQSRFKKGDQESKKIDKYPRYPLTIYWKYVQYEEKYGNGKKVARVMEDAIRFLKGGKEKLVWMSLFAEKIRQLRGISYTREIYQRAISELKLEHPEELCKICISFSEVEQEMNEIDRARGILSFASQFGFYYFFFLSFTLFYSFECNTQVILIGFGRNGIYSR